MRQADTTLKGLRNSEHGQRKIQNDTTPLGLEMIVAFTQGSSRTRNPGLTDAIPLGLFQNTELLLIADH